MKNLFIFSFFLIVGTLHAQFENYEDKIRHDLEILSELPSDLAFKKDLPLQKTIDPALAAKLQEALEDIQTEIGAVGIGGALVLPGDDIWSGAVGKSTASETLTTEHTFGVGSVTKTLTGALLAELDAEGILSLDDRLTKWIPKYDFVDSTITIRQCLNHTTGVYNVTDNPLVGTNVIAAPLKVWTADEILKTFLSDPIFSPGERWSYSNSNFLLAGLVAEAATGNDFHTEINHRFFAKLNMNSAHIFPQAMNAAPMSHLWADLLNTGTVSDLQAQGLSMNALFSMAWAAGSAVSTPADIAWWMKKLVAGSAVSAQAKAEMTDFFSVGPGFNYGLGLSALYANGIELIGHGGNIIYTSEVYYIPDFDIAIAVSTNDGSETEIIKAFNALLNAYLEYLDTVSVEENILVAKVSTFPNPTSGSFSFSLDLAQSTEVSAAVFDILGNQILNLPAERVSAGDFTKEITGFENFDSGTYFLKINIGESLLTEKISKF